MVLALLLSINLSGITGRKQTLPDYDSRDKRKASVFFLSVVVQLQMILFLFPSDINRRQRLKEDGGEDGGEGGVRDSPPSSVASSCSQSVLLTILSPLSLY